MVSTGCVTACFTSAFGTVWVSIFVTMTLLSFFNADSGSAFLLERADVIVKPTAFA